MKRLLSIWCACVLLLGASSSLFAAAGGSCSTAIPLGKNYSTNITGQYPKTVWYSARTFDLPLSVYFVPEHGASDPKPDVEMDFSCTSGIYTDSILCSLFCTNGGSIKVDMPHRPVLQSGTTDDGDFCYYLAIGKEYRDLLLQAGIDYNVQVFVKVVYYSSGEINITPDDMFTNCMAAKFLHFGDTVHVNTRDTNRHVVVPYVQWQEDSIRYVWDGTDPVILSVGDVCDYDPTDNGDEHVLYFKTLQSQDTAKLTSAQLKHYIHSGEVSSEAGMFYAKFYTEGTGVMKIERVPQAPPEGGATLLRYDKTTPIPADTNALFAMSYTWDTATVFTTPTNHVFKMYVGTTYDFHLPDAIASYQFHADDKGHWLGLLTEQMRELWTHTDAQYLYIRFECTGKTTLTPSIWDIPYCQDRAREILYPSTTLSVQRSGQGAVYYRFYYCEWKDGDMTFRWRNSTSTCPFVVGDTCTFGTASSDPHRLYAKTVSKNGTQTWLASNIATKANRVDADGFLYIRFSPEQNGTMTITTTAPPEEDPAPVDYAAATIHVVCSGEPTAAGQEYIIRVSTPQTLHIDNGTPWDQEPGETRTVTIPAGSHILYGAEETILIEVK